MRTRIAALVLSSLLAGPLLGCVAPSVPIPPPSPESMSFSIDADAGTAQFAYQASESYAGATVYVFNRDVGEGIITTADQDGAVLSSQPFPAEVGNEIIVSFERGEQFGSTCVRLQPGPSSSALECDL